MSDILVRFVHISDTHLHSDPTYNEPHGSNTPQVTLQGLIKALSSLPFRPDFVLHTGDVVYNPDLSVYAYARDELAKLGLPVYYVRGNHDSSEGIQQVLMNWQDTTPKLNYTFEVNGVQFVVLDSNEPTQVNLPAGLVSADQLAWLETLCSADDSRPLVVAVHHNVIPSGAPWVDNLARIQNGEEVHRILLKARDRLRGVFYGHIHQQIDQYRDGLLYIAAASAWAQLGSWPIPENTDITLDRESPPGFSVVAISKDTTHIRRHTFTV